MRDHGCHDINTINGHTMVNSINDSLIFPSSPFCLLESSSASCCFLFSALAACSLRILFSYRKEQLKWCSGTFHDLCGRNKPLRSVILTHHNKSLTFKALRKSWRKVLMVLKSSSSESWPASSQRYWARSPFLLSMLVKRSSRALHTVRFLYRNTTGKWLDEKAGNSKL